MSKSKFATILTDTHHMGDEWVAAPDLDYAFGDKTQVRHSSNGWLHYRSGRKAKTKLLGMTTGIYWRAAGGQSDSYRVILVSANLTDVQLEYLAARYSHYVILIAIPAEGIRMMGNLSAAMDTAVDLESSLETIIDSPYTRDCHDNLLFGLLNVRRWIDLIKDAGAEFLPPVDDARKMPQWENEWKDCGGDSNSDWAVWGNVDIGEDPEEEEEEDEHYEKPKKNNVSEDDGGTSGAKAETSTPVTSDKPVITGPGRAARGSFHADSTASEIASEFNRRFTDSTKGAL